MKTVLFVSHSAELNGAEIWLLETLRRIDRRSFRPCLVVPRPGPLVRAAEDAGVEKIVIPAKWWLTEKSGVWRQPAAWLWNRGSVRRLVRTVRERGIDLVFSNSAATFGGTLAARKAGVPHVWSIHEIVRGEGAQLRYFFGAKALGRLIIRRSAGVIVNSEATRASLPPSEKVALVYNGLEINSGDPARQDALRKAFGLAGDEIGVAVIGKIYPGKRQGHVVEAAGLLRPKYPRLKLFLVGEVKDESYAAGIRAAVRSAGREDRVVWTGYVSDLTNFLKLMSAVVSASVVESFGRAALEGMAAGVPVIAVRAGGLAEIIEPGVNGDLVASPEPKALAAALDALLSDETRRKAYVECGYETIRKKFSVSRQVRDVENLLADILVGEERKIFA